AEVAGDRHMDLLLREAHLEGAGEDAMPALHDGVPADQRAPSRMDAADVRRAQPDRLHLGGVEALERAVEGVVRGEHGVAIRHDGFGAIMTSSTRRPGPGLRTPWPSPAGAQTRSPGPTSRSSSPTVMRPVPSST